MLTRLAAPLLFLALAAGQGQANSGPPIPPPALSVAGAVESAERALSADQPNARDFIVLSVDYTNRLGAGDADWGWAVTFVHPVRNDRSLTYAVDSAGTATLVSETE